MAVPDPFGPEIAPPLAAGERQRLLADVAPALRGLVSARSPKVMHYADSPAVLEFVGSRRCEELARLGTTCPDHFLRTRVRPLFVPFAPGRECAADLLRPSAGRGRAVSAGIRSLLRRDAAVRLAADARSRHR